MRTGRERFGATPRFRFDQHIFDISKGDHGGFLRENKMKQVANCNFDSVPASSK